MLVFDPLGLIAHFLVFVKALLQEMWRKQMGWDEELDDDLFNRWLSWTRLLPRIESIEIPRCYLQHSALNDNQEVQLHIFVDAGEQAYAAVAYLRTGCEGHFEVAVICAKSRVAPLKAMSIPRLELEGALLGTRLANSVSAKHSITFTSRHFWSDSQTVLGWLKSDHRRYRQFVSFRVSEILDTTDMSQWRYVPTKENVADERTKWAKIPNLTSSDRWFMGPEFLYHPQEKWPADISTKNMTDEELRSHYHHFVQNPRPIIFQNFSTWRGLRRGLAGAIRYTRNLLTRTRSDNGFTTLTGSYCLTLTKVQYLQAEMLIFTQAQSEGFPKEIEILKGNLNTAPDHHRRIDRSSPIYDKRPYLDERGIIRAWERIDAASGVSQ